MKESNVLQAVIMAGGKGTRLQSITGDLIPKPMVPVEGKPLLLWQIKNLKENGIKNFIFVIGHLGHVIREYFSDGSEYGVQIIYYEEKEPLGTAGALYELMDQLEEQFYLVFGDILFDVDLNRMQRFHCNKNAAVTLFVHPNTHPEDSDLVVLDNEEKVIQIDRKNRERKGWYHNCVNAGLYIFSKKALLGVTKRGNVDLERDVLSTLCRCKVPVYAYKSTEYVRDIGTMERINEAVKDLQNGYVVARNLRKQQRAIFCERDCLLSNYDTACGTKHIEITAGASEAVKRINQSEYLLILTVGRPLTKKQRMSNIEQQINCQLETLLGKEGAFADEICMQNSFEKEDMRFVSEIIARYNINCKESWMIVQSADQLFLGEQAGFHMALVSKKEKYHSALYNNTFCIKQEMMIDVVEHIMMNNNKKLNKD